MGRREIVSFWDLWKVRDSGTIFAPLASFPQIHYSMSRFWKYGISRIDSLRESKRTIIQSRSGIHEWNYNRNR